MPTRPGPQVIKKKRTLFRHLGKIFKTNELTQNEDPETEINKALKEPLQISKTKEIPYTRNKSEI
jgi:hypothetical protein